MPFLQGNLSPRCFFSLPSRGESVYKIKIKSSIDLFAQSYSDHDISCKSLLANANLLLDVIDFCCFRDIV